MAGIVTGGKGIQRLLSGAGTAVGLDAWMQRSQQEWMKRKGWGKDRHEYISKQIALMSGKTKRGEVVDKEIEERLKERERIEKDNEMRRTGIAAIAGALVGSGAAFRVADEYLGISDKVREASNYWGDKWGHLFGGGGEAIAPHHRIIEGTAPAPETSPKIPSPVTTPAPETSPKITPPITTPAPETLAPITIKPIELSIGTRGPEGALIDEFRKDPELAKKFGWQGGSKEELSKWAGSKARVLWEHSAKQALLDPSIKQELGKLGYPETAEGYEKAMTRIGKGTVSLDIEKGSITLNAEYLKNIISPSVPSSVSIPYEELTQPSGVTVNYMVGGVPQTPIHETLLSQHTPTPSSPVPPIDFAEIQKQMDLPEGKLRGILTTSGVRSPAIEDLLKREGGVEKLLKMQVRELHGIEQGYPRDARLDRLYEGLQRITGDARLESNDTLEDVLKSIDSKKIFHGTAEEILKDEIPAPLETGASSHSEGIGTATNPEEIPAPSDQGETANETQIDERAEEAPRPSSVASTDIPREELAKSTEVKTSDMAKEIGQVSSYEVVTKTGIKGIFNYDANGKITDMKIGGSESLLRGRSLLYDNYEEIMRKKGAKLMDVRLVDLSAQKLFYQEQLLKTLEDSGQKNSDKAEFLRKAIKDATNQLESKFGNIFKK